MTRITIYTILIIVLWLIFGVDLGTDVILGLIIGQWFLGYDTVKGV